MEIPFSARGRTVDYALSRVHYIWKCKVMTDSESQVIHRKAYSEAFWTFTGTCLEWAIQRTHIPCSLYVQHLDYFNYIVISGWNSIIKQWWTMEMDGPVQGTVSVYILSFTYLLHSTSTLHTRIYIGMSFIRSLWILNAYHRSTLDTWKKPCSKISVDCNYRYFHIGHFFNV